MSAPDELEPADTLVEGGAPDPATTLDEAVLGLEERRTRQRALTTLIAASLGAFVVVMLLQWRAPRPHYLYEIFAVLLVGMALLCAGILLQVRRGKITVLQSALTGVTVGLLGVFATAAFGFSSFAVVGLPPVVYYFGLTDARARHLVPFLTIMVGYAAVLALFALELLPAPPPVEPPYELWIVVGAGSWVLLVLTATYWLARRSRGATLEAMMALEQARRRARRNEALLHEAHQNLSAIAGGGAAGRLTGSEVEGLVVGDVLGRGAMGAVYALGDPEEGEGRWAMKVLHHHALAGEGAQERFQREVGIVSALRSPHIPRARSHGVLSDGCPYLIMERLHGEDLATVLRRRGQLRLEELDELVDGATRALDVAHAGGVVHRDVKPQNLFFVEEPEPLWKVLDFGVSKLVDSSGTLTQGGFIGTPGYIAPEQIQSGHIDGRADIFSLGAVLYRALTGAPAFSGRDHVAVIYDVLQGTPTEPLGVAPALVDVLAICLAKDPDDRFADATELRGSWLRARRGRDPDLAARAARALAKHPWSVA